MKRKKLESIKKPSKPTSRRKKTQPSEVWPASFRERDNLVNVLLATLCGRDPASIVQSYMLDDLGFLPFQHHLTKEQVLRTARSALDVVDEEDDYRGYLPGVTHSQYAQWIKSHTYYKDNELRDRKLQDTPTRREISDKAIAAAYQIFVETVRADVYPGGCLSETQVKTLLRYGDEEFPKNEKWEQLCTLFHIENKSVTQLILGPIRERPLAYTTSYADGSFDCAQIDPHLSTLGAMTGMAYKWHGLSWFMFVRFLTCNPPRVTYPVAAASPFFRFHHVISPTLWRQETCAWDALLMGLAAIWQVDETVVAQTLKTRVRHRCDDMGLLYRREAAILLVQ